VNVTALPYPPYWDSATDSGGGVHHSGADYEMINAIAQALNFSYRIMPTENWDEVGVDYCTLRELG
jgi:hypothetical protein